MRSIDSKSEVAERTVQMIDASSPIVSAECRQRKPNLAIAELIKKRIEENGTYAFYFNEVTCECATGVLKVGGRVPTDRLKKVLWSLIRDLDDIIAIEDRLDVVSSTGLSSGHPRQLKLAARCDDEAE